jgi:ABC-type multidrug transport system fused ATPase/permease subunit
LTDYVVREVERRGCRVESPRGEGEWSGILLLAPPAGGPRAGDIVAVMGIECATGDTYCAEGANLSLESIYAAEPVIDLSIQPVKRAEQLRPAEKLLEVEDVTLADLSARNVSFYARAGEITGIAGLVGCGKSEIVRAVYGLEAVASGSIRVRDEDMAARPTPIDMLRRGVCYFPSDRVAEGLALGRPVVAFGFVGQHTLS